MCDKVVIEALKSICIKMKMLYQKRKKKKKSQLKPHPLNHKYNKTPVTEQKQIIKVLLLTKSRGCKVKVRTGQRQREQSERNRR